MVIQLAKGEERVTTRDRESIQDKVRFWEEQDKINQELIPRVIRQNELLSAHVADHDNLPALAANAASEALRTAREGDNHRYEQALAAAKQDLIRESVALRRILIGISSVAVAACIIAILVALFV